MIVTCCSRRLKSIRTDPSDAGTDTIRVAIARLSVGLLPFLTNAPKTSSRLTHRIGGDARRARELSRTNAVVYGRKNDLGPASRTAYFSFGSGGRAAAHSRRAVLVIVARLAAGGEWSCRADPPDARSGAIDVAIAHRPARLRSGSAYTLNADAGSTQRIIQATGVERLTGAKPGNNRADIENDLARRTAKRGFHGD
jgi:hypothetical protein